MSEDRPTTFEHFFHEYAGKHKHTLDNDKLMEIIERSFYAGAMGGVGVVANRISLLDGSRDPADVINNISKTIMEANTELQIKNERFNGEVGTA